MYQITKGLIVVNFVSRDMLQDRDPVPAVEMSPQRGVFFILKVLIYVIVLFFMSNSFVFFIFNSTVSSTE
jgi:hypothetical protein